MSTASESGVRTCQQLLEMVLEQSVLTVYQRYVNPHHTLCCWQCQWHGTPERDTKVERSDTPVKALSYYLFERCGTEDFPCRAQISCWPASPARVRYLGCAASAVASASAIPSDGSVEDLVRAGVLLHQLDVTVPSNAAISLLTGLAAVQRADGHRVLAGCRKLRCVYAFRADQA